LIEELRSDNLVLVENATLAIAYIVEDSSQMFEGNKYNKTMMNLIEALGLLFETSNEKILLNILQTFNILITTSNEIMINHTGTYLQALLLFKN